MKRWVWGILICALIGSCSTSNDSDTTTPTQPSGSAPIISDLSCAPTAATTNQGGGALTVTCSFNFSDPDKDVKTVRTTNPNGSTTDTSVQIQASGLAAGSLSAGVVADTTKAQTYTFQIWLIDAAGNESNKLTGSVTVSAAAGS
jgi:hypothetical protein